MNSNINSMNNIELLAPAGNLSCLKAALEQGADAVYFGLKTLNARRGAGNFHHKKLKQTVDLVHSFDTKAYLTLNIDLAEREKGQAVRTLALAEESGVDAVLITDPALLYFVSHFPELEFHFSTQAGVSNSKGMELARDLGIKRVVLARELSCAEIAACSAVSGIETEVFVQGALCFCASGRCLLSSWGGGRSGNRGTCTSPCRVPWRTQEKNLGTPFSMCDLSLISRLDELRDAGVSCLKIEGRLKNTEWVGNAVSLYRKALDYGVTEELVREVASLGDYSGRKMTSGYFDSKKENLIAVSARPSLRQHDKESFNNENKELSPQSDGDEDNAATYEFACLVSGEKLEFKVMLDEEETIFSLPKSKVVKEDRAIAVSGLIRWLSESRIQKHGVSEAVTDDMDFLIPRKTANKVADRISGIIHKARKGSSDIIRFELSDEVKNILKNRQNNEGVNKISLGTDINAARVDVRDFDSFSVSCDARNIIIENISDENQLGKIQKKDGANLTVSLPAVIYEKNIGKIEKIINRAVKKGFDVEVNDWSGLKLATILKAEFSSGPGLAVLNALAAEKLYSLGAKNVKVSIEADRKKLEEFSSSCSVPCSITVFARPSLMFTRALTDRHTFQEKTIEDKRDIRLKSYRRGELIDFRPENPFTLAGIINKRIKAAFFEADLTTSPSAIEEWYDIISSIGYRGKKKNFTFNYDKSLY